MGLRLPPPLEPMPTWRTLDEAAKQLKISRRTLTKWVSNGKIRGYTIAGDRHRYVDLDEIRKLREPKPIERPDDP
jgi:excisionase family DNA binding protein